MCLTLVHVNSFYPLFCFLHLVFFFLFTFYLLLVMYIMNICVNIVVCYWIYYYCYNVRRILIWLAFSLLFLLFFHGFVNEIFCILMTIKSILTLTLVSLENDQRYTLIETLWKIKSNWQWRSEQKALLCLLFKLRELFSWHTHWLLQKINEVPEQKRAFYWIFLVLRLK